MRVTAEVTRELYLPRELVFDAWTQSEHLAQWYVPADCRVGEVVVEPVPGGRFEIGWTDNAGRDVCEVGRFAEITAPERFVCRMSSGGGDAGVGGSLLRLELSDQVDACSIVLHEEGGAGSAGESWEDRLDRLEAYFSAI